MAIAIGFFVATCVGYFGAVWLVARVRRWQEGRAFDTAAPDEDYVSDAWLREHIRGRREP